MSLTPTTDLVRLDASTTVPVRRLGALLRATRLAADDDLEGLAARSDGRYDVGDLVEIEAGGMALGDVEVASLLALYRAEPGELIAARSTLIIDLDEGTVAAGPWSTPLPDPGAPDDVLARYLALVYEMRHLPAGTPLPLRSLDVRILAEALALPADDVETRLELLMEPENPSVGRVRHLLSRRLLVPAAGLVVAATAVGVLLFVSTGEATSDPVGPPQVAPPGADDPVIGEGIAVEAPVQVAPPGADDPVIGDALTIEN